MYQLRGRLGRWGFGEIYEAVHTDSGEVRMLKLVRGRRATDPQVRQHLAREFELASRVDHPNIMTVRGFERTPGLGIHLVLERMEGDTLAEMLKRGVTFLPPVAADVCSGVMAGLSACHAAGFGHFELSSETVFLQKTGLSASHPLITGFGFPPPQDSADEAATLPLEALPYAAPERRTGKRWDLRADIYSACAILMQLLTRQAPPPHGWQTPPSLPDPKTELAQKLHNVAARGLEPDPGQRPQQMHELLAQVRALIAAPPAAAPPAAEPSGRSETPDRAQAVFSTHEYAASRQRTGRPRRQQAARKTVLGLGAVGNRRSGGPQRAPQPKKTPLATTHPGLQAPPRPQGEDSSRAVGTTGLAAAGQADEKANNRQEPPPIPPSPPAAAAPLQDSVQDDAPPAEKLALVGSEAAREEVGQEPLEPGFFPGSQTGPMLAVDPSEVVETELPAPVLQKPKKSWLKWVIGVVLVGVLGTAVALVVVFEPWRDLQGETRPSTGAKGKEPKTRKARTQPRTADGAAKQKSDGSVAETGGGTDAGVSAADAQGDAKTMDAQVDAQVPDAGSPVAVDGGEKPPAARGQENKADSPYTLYLRQGRRAMHHGRYKLARRQFTKALRIRSRSYRARRYMGEAHYRAREYWAAVHWFKKALKISRNSASTHVRLGRAYMKVNKRSRACKHFKKASKLRPNSRSYRRIVENYRCR